MASLENYGKRVFTDREELQKLFVKRCAEFVAEKNEHCHILNFWGVGGIGKTQLCYRLQRLISDPEKVNNREEYEDVNNEAWLSYSAMDSVNKELSSMWGDLHEPWLMTCTAMIDFPQDHMITDVEILFKIRNSLKARNSDDFKFPRFDAAIMKLNKSANQSFFIDDQTKSSIISENYWLKAAFDVGSNIPYYGVYVAAVKAGLTALEGIVDDRNNRKVKTDYKGALQRIDSFEIQELKGAIIGFFIDDMKENILRINKKIVIFLDTYENYEDSYRQHPGLNYDKWFWKDPESIVYSIPNTMWVVMGRDELAWGKKSKLWKRIEHKDESINNMESSEAWKGYYVLETCLLFDFNEDYSKDYLKNAGIPPCFWNHFYAISQGTPCFLNLLISNYIMIKRSGNEPVLKDFDDDMAYNIERYASYLPENRRLVLFLFACLGDWDENFIKKCIDRLKKNNDYSASELSYHDYIRHSFIIRRDDDTYYFHKTIQKHVISLMKEDYQYDYSKIVKAVLDTCKDVLLGTYRLNDWERFVKLAIQSDVGSDFFYENYDLIHRTAFDIECVYLGEELLPYYESIYNYLYNNTLTSKKTLLLYEAAFIVLLIHNGRIKEAKKHYYDFINDGNNSVIDEHCLCYIYYTQGLCSCALFKNYDDAILHYKTAMEHLALEDRLNYTRLTRSISECYFHKKDFKASLDYLLSINPHDVPELDYFYIIMNIGNNYLELYNTRKDINDYKSAEEYYMKALDWSKSKGDFMTSALAYKGIADFYENTHEYDDELHYLKQALCLLEENNMSEDVLAYEISLNKSITEFNIDHNREKTVEELLNLLEKTQKECDDYYFDLRLDIANALFKTQKEDISMGVYNEIKEYYESLGVCNIATYYEAQKGYGKCLYNKEQYNQALVVFTDLLELIDSEQDYNIILKSRCIGNIACCYYSLHRCEEASRYFIKELAVLIDNNLTNEFLADSKIALLAVNNMCGEAMNKKQYKRAKDILAEGIRVTEKGLSDDVAKIYMEFVAHTGDLLCDEGKRGKALEFYKKAIRICENHGQKLAAWQIIEQASMIEKSLNTRKA